MELKPSQHEGATEWEPARRLMSEGPRHTVRQPPFFADFVRRSAIDHLKSYRSLSRRNFGGNIDANTAQRSSRLDRPHEINNNDTTVTRSAAQAMLMTDLQRLLAAITSLERILRRGRLARWLINGTLAALWHAVVINLLPASIRQGRDVPSRAGSGSRQRNVDRLPFLPHNLTTFLATPAYLLTLPLFSFPLLKYEKKLSCTLVVKDEIRDLCHLVHNGAVLGDNDVSVLVDEDERWDVVPWGKVEG